MLESLRVGGGGGGGEGLALLLGHGEFLHAQLCGLVEGR